MSADGELKNALSFLQGSICRGDLEAAYPDRLKLRRMLREGEIEDEELRLGALVLHAHLSLPQIERVAVSAAILAVTDPESAARGVRRALDG